MVAVNRLIATVLALGLIAVGVVGAAEAIWQLTGHDQQLWVHYYLVTTQLQQLTWSHPYVLGAAGVLAVAGLLLLVAGLRRGPRPLRLATYHDDVRIEAPRRTVRRLVSNAAMSVDGVLGVKVTARRRRVKVRATAAPEPPDSLTEDIEARVGEQLDALSPLRRPRIVTALKAQGRKATS